MIYIVKKIKSKSVNIIISFIIITLILTNQIYAKYNYTVVLDAFSLNRDNSQIEYQIQKSVADGEYTNKDIVLTITSNKKIEEVEGFSLDETRTILTKTVTENEEKNIILEDLSGNKKEVNYSITNIDKEPPQIVGIEDGETYNEQMSVEYTDNIGVKDVKAYRYDGYLNIRYTSDYYDTSALKGIYVLGNQIYVDVTKRPENTRYYKFYLNNKLKATTEKSEYTFTGLSNGTSYKVKVEAIDENDEVIESITKTIKTKFFTKITSQKNGNNFNVKISGINSKAKSVTSHLWNEDCSSRIIKNPSINSDRSLNLSFNAYDVNGKKCSGYYYFHIQFFDSNSTLLETLCINVIFNTSSYVKEDDDTIDINNLNKNGIYEIIVTDLAGNETRKKCTVKI